jgi:hypothetical protein
MVTMAYTFEEDDYGLHISVTRPKVTHLRNTIMVYTFEEHHCGLHI